MSAPRFYLKQTSNKKSETLIFLSFTYRKRRLRISTEISIQPRYWNASEQVARDVSAFKEKAYEINAKLKEKRDAIEDAYDYFKKQGIDDPEIEQLKEQYKIQLTPELEHPKQQAPKFWVEFDNFIESSKGRVVNDVIKDYRSLKKHLMAFEKHKKLNVNFNVFNYSFYQSFVHFLMYDTIKPNGEKGLATNTVGKQIKNLKAFLNHCFKHELVERFDLSNFVTVTEETDAIYLSEDELLKIYNCDLSSKKHLEESRDLLVLGCQTGLRLQDLFRLRPEMLRDGKIYITPNKTNKQVVIPLQYLAKEIVHKYHGDFPNKWNKTNFNAEIKEIGELAEINSNYVITFKKGIEKVDKTFKKFQLISSHTCRRSFCTNSFLMGVPPILIMKISGHKTEKAFLRYIKIDEEMAAEKIEEYWSFRKNTFIPNSM